MESQENKELENQYRLLLNLEKVEGFRLWRDEVCLPVLDQIEAQMATPLELTEANLKALVMYRNLVSSLFEGIFKQIRTQKEIDEK